MLSPRLAVYYYYISELRFELVFLPEITFSIHCQNSICLLWFIWNTISFTKPSSRPLATQEHHLLSFSAAFLSNFSLHWGSHQPHLLPPCWEPSSHSPSGSLFCKTCVCVGLSVCPLAFPYQLASTLWEGALHCYSSCLSPLKLWGALLHPRSPSFITYWVGLCLCLCSPWHTCSLTISFVCLS